MEVTKCSGMICEWLIDLSGVSEEAALQADRADQISLSKRTIADRASTLVLAHRDVLA
jgi:hypothetical protein